MTGFERGNKKTKGSNDCLTFPVNFEGIPLLPGLPDDVAKYCLALVPRSSFPTMGGVCKTWRSFIQSKEFLRERTLLGVLEDWLYVLTMDSQGNDRRRWEVFDHLGHKRQIVRPMPGPAKLGFGVTVVNGKLLCIAGYSVINGVSSASPDVYQYEIFYIRLKFEPISNCRWSKLADLNVARGDFACAEVNGMVYVVGGYGIEGKSLSTVEVYDPETGKWTFTESLRRPRWGCFACGLNVKLYVLGGRSSFTIGHSRYVDVYDPRKRHWCEMKNSGCVMVTTHAVVEKKLFCIEWENQRKVAIFDPDNGSWKRVRVPVTGSTSIGFRLGNKVGKLVLFSAEGDQTPVYDPNATPDSEWRTSNISLRVYAYAV